VTDKRRDKEAGFQTTPKNWMLAPIKPIIKQLLPPVAVSIARSVLRQRGSREWEHVPEGWRQTRTQGWHDLSIAATQQRKWSDFVAAVSGTEPLGVAHESTHMTRRDLCAHNMLLVYGYVLTRASRDRDEMSVLDWGGGTGHYAVIAQALLPEVTIRYTVKEVPELCRAGQENLPQVTFTNAEDVCFSQTYDLVLASGSLQYEEDWRRLLSRLASCGKSWLYVTRLPLVSKAATFVVVQRPYAYGYESEYVSWVLNRQEFLNHAASIGLKLEREFLLNEHPHVAGAPEQFEGCGFLFRTPARCSVKDRWS
jgi:putative methyltransferase (TIGR04325 family)